MMKIMAGQFQILAKMDLEMPGGELT